VARRVTKANKVAGMLCSDRAPGPRLQPSVVFFPWAKRRHIRIGAGRYEWTVSQKGTAAGVVDWYTWSAERFAKEHSKIKLPVPGQCFEAELEL